MSQTLLQTPLHDRHVALGARMVPFAGWEMPVQYEGVIQEHRAVRTDAGVFDVSHMGEFEVEGPQALALLQSLLSNDLDRLEPGQAQYTLLTNETRRDRRRPDRLPARTVPLPAHRERRESRGRLPLDQGARGERLRRARRLRRVRAPRGAGTERDREARPAARAGVHLRGGGHRRHAGDGQSHRLHGRGRLRAPLHGRGRRRALGRSARARGHAVRARARATRFASRRAIRCTATTSRRRPTRSRPASAGRARSRRTSPASRCCVRSRSAGPSGSSSRS